MILPSKSKWTFDASCQEVKANRDGNVYMWTFTFAQSLDVSESRLRWSNFLRALRNRYRYSSFNGLRVFELHPRGHGLHIHVLTECYLQVQDVRALWLRCGGGRVHVLPIAHNRTGYLGKYLRKQGRPECFKGVRMWSAFGGFPALKVKDTKIESNWSRIYAYLRQTARSVCGFTFDKLKWFERQQAVANVERGRVWFWGLARFVQLGDSEWDGNGQTEWLSSPRLFPAPAPAFGNYGIPD